MDSKSCFRCSASLLLGVFSAVVPMALVVRGFATSDMVLLVINGVVIVELGAFVVVAFPSRIIIAGSDFSLARVVWSVMNQLPILLIGYTSEL